MTRHDVLSRIHIRVLQCACLDPKAKCPPNMINPFACKCGTEKTTTDAGCPKVQCKKCEYKSLRIDNGHVHSHAP